MRQLALMEEEYTGPITRETQYGSVITLSKNLLGKFMIVEVEEGEEDYVVFFEDYHEALIAFKHFYIDINSAMELKEDGTIGFYPKARKEQPSSIVQPSLFDFVQPSLF